jgi:putative peptidoglycan lipid II flippase
MGVRGLVIASTSAIIVQTLLLQRALVKKIPGLTFKPLWISLLKVIAATALMAIVVAGLWHYVDTWLVTNLVKGLVAVGFIIPCAVAVYGVLLFVLKIEGREELVSLVKRKLVK